MKFHGFGRALAAAAALLALSAPALAIDPLPANWKAVPDPAVRTGTLPDGLRYAIMRNGSPAKAVSIRLAIRAGSYDEEQAESGFAHFIEHMAFRSTRRAPEGSLRPLVEAARGVAGELAKGAISPEELDAARTPMLASADQALGRNDPWASMIAHSGADRSALRELTGLRSDLEALTIEDVRRAAATWLTPSPMLSRAIPAPR